MHIAVTGGSGNVARIMMGHLHMSGHTVRSIDRPERDAPAGVREHCTLDLRDNGAVKDALRGCDGVVHLAAIPGLGLGLTDAEVYANNTGFYDCSKAERVLGWRHQEHP
jgi:nucleoside-diphosphate-sugar epimerase